MNSSLYSFVLIILLIGVDCQLLRRRPGDVCAGCPVEQSPYDRDVRLAAFAAIRQLGPGHRLLWIYRAQTGVGMFMIYVHIKNYSLLRYNVFE